MARSRAHTCARKLLVGDRGWHVGARPHTDGEGRLAGVVGSRGAWADYNQRGAARARRKRQFNFEPHTSAWASASAAARDLGITLHLCFFVKECDVDRAFALQQSISIQVSHCDTYDGEGCRFWVLWAKLDGVFVTG